MVQIAEKTVCYHCGEDCNNNALVAAGKSFCCQGCKTVFEILNGNGLCTYYDLNSTPGISQKATVRENKFSFLDDPAIRDSLIDFRNEKQTHITFYLPQIHCSSCLWLLENLRKLETGIIESKVNFISREVFVTFDNNVTTLRKVVELLTVIGYEPHLSLDNTDSKKATDPDRSQLYKLGIAGFCFANIMMMSFPEYLSQNGHLDLQIAHFFKYINVVLSLPVFFYAASGFFISAWKALKSKFLNIDAQIALAILLTFLRSLYEIFSGTGAGYLDSMSGIVFFMLIGRWGQSKTYSSISFNRDYKSFFPISVNVIKDDIEIPTSLENIKTGDIIRLYNNELVPVDCMLSKGNAQIDYSFVTGESVPVAIQPGEIIYAGGKQLAGVVELLVIKEVSQSYLTNLWNKDAFKSNTEESVGSPGTELEFAL